MRRVGPALRRRWVRVVLAAVLVVVAIGCLGAVLGGLSARRSLAQGRDALTRGRELLVQGDAAGAAEVFEQARARFASALDETSGPWLRLAGWIPILGRTPAAVDAIAQAGLHVAGAGSTLSGALEGIGGIAALAPSHGRIPIATIQELAPSVSRALEEVGVAVEELEGAPRSLLLGPVASARADAAEEIGSLHDLLGTASSLLDRLPAFLGSERPRRYFFGAQNPAELRGTGGVVGAFAILTVQDGFLSFSPFRPIQSLPLPPLREVPGPSQEYADNYDEFRGDGRFWLAINLTPDFPTAAEALVQAYAVATGERLDGVILSDPFALAALMRLTGPTTVPDLDITLTADRVVAFTTNEAYALLTVPEERKRLLGDVAQRVVGRFLRDRELDGADLRTLAHVAGQGHLLVYSTDPAIESALVRTGSGGALGEGDGDLLAVVENSSGGNKVDFYEDRSVSYEVWLRPDGSARAAATITLTNHAPATGLPAYVIGPDDGFSRAGESAQILSVYCGSGCRLERAELDGTRIGVEAGTELGHPFFREDFRTASGATSELRLSWYLPSAWEGGSTGGTYRLTWLDQPTIRPDVARVIVHLPEGMHAVGTTAGMRAQDGTVTWQGSPEGTLELTVEFEPSALVRLWRLVTPG